MDMESALRERSGSTCELCGSSEGLTVLDVSPGTVETAERCAMTCAICREQVERDAGPDPHHWRCLNESMWSEVPAVQVLAWRMLDRLSAESWARELLETLYLDEEMLAWAQAGRADLDESNASGPHLDSNGAVLEAGDTVTLTKDLVVKGAGFTAKRGTAVRGITLVTENPEHIEGRVSGQRIVILTKFVKKS